MSKSAAEDEMLISLADEMIQNAMEHGVDLEKVRANASQMSVTIEQDSVGEIMITTHQDTPADKAAQTQLDGNIANISSLDEEIRAKSITDAIMQAREEGVPGGIGLGMMIQIAMEHGGTFKAEYEEVEGVDLTDENRPKRPSLIATLGAKPTEAQA